jgi:formylglycine-generating enzyme required for sulfatase activity
MKYPTRWPLPLLFMAALMNAAAGPAAQRGIALRVTDAAGQPVTLYRESHALLVGVSDYSAGWPDLESVPAELRRVETALERQGFHVVRYLNPDGRAMRRAFEDFIGRYGYRPDNRLLFFFAGHGHTRLEGRKGYLVPADAPDPRLDEGGFLRTALAMSDILNWARRVEAKHALFLFDACFSGTVFTARDLPQTPPHIGALTAAPVRQFITAGSAGEPVPAQSVFTPAFIDGIQHGLADLDEDGYVTGTELGVYLQGRVPRHARQTPQFGKISDYELSRGDFLFRVGQGSPVADAEAPVVGPALVTVPAGGKGMPAFDMGRTEVTMGEFARFVSATGHVTDAERRGSCYARAGGRLVPDPGANWREPGWHQDEGHPVACVSWNDAVAYTRWLSRSTGSTYRLPTASEWERAARAGTAGERYWLDDLAAACRYANVADESARERHPRWTVHPCRDGYVRTAPVGTFAPNPFGLYDMLGNVAEWTCSATDPDRCAPPGEAGGRMLRGATFSTRPPSRLGFGHGMRRPADFAGKATGIRVLRERSEE